MLILLFNAVLIVVYFVPTTCNYTRTHTQNYIDLHIGTSAHTCMHTNTHKRTLTNSSAQANIGLVHTLTHSCILTVNTYAHPQKALLHVCTLIDL